MLVQALNRSFYFLLLALLGLLGSVGQYHQGHGKHSIFPEEMSIPFITQYPPSGGTTPRDRKGQAMGFLCVHEATFL